MKTIAACLMMFLVSFAVQASNGPHFARPADDDFEIVPTRRFTGFTQSNNWNAFAFNRYSPALTVYTPPFNNFAPTYWCSPALAATCPAGNNLTGFGSGTFWSP